MVQPEEFGADDTLEAAMKTSQPSCMSFRLLLVIGIMAYGGATNIGYTGGLQTLL
jgi:hypothetical protein